MAGRKRMQCWKEASGGSGGRAFYPLALVYSRAEVLETVGRWSEAEESYRRAHEWGRRAGDPYDSASAAVRLGSICARKGMYDEAFALTDGSLSTFEAMGKEVETADACGRISTMHKDRADYRKAMEYRLRQLDIYGKLGATGLKARATGEMGMIYKGMGDYGNALRCYLERLQHAKAKEGPKDLCRILGNIGELYRSSGRYQRAMRCYLLSIGMARYVGDLPVVANGLGNVGIVHDLCGRREQAMDCYSRQLDIDRRLGNRYGMARAYNNMGVIHGKNGQYGLASACNQRYREMARQLGDRRADVIADVNQADIEYKRHRYSLARGLYGEAESRCREHGLDVYLPYIYIGLTKIGLLRKEYASARAQAAKALDAAVRFRNREVLGWARILEPYAGYLTAGDDRQRADCRQRLLEAAEGEEDPDLKAEAFFLSWKAAVEGSEGSDFCRRRAIELTAERLRRNPESALHYRLMSLGAEGTP